MKRFGGHPQDKKENRVDLEETHEITGKNVSALLSPFLIQELSTPPAIFRSVRYGDDIASLEIKLLFDRCAIVIKCFY